MVAELRIYFEGDRRLKPGLKAFFRDLYAAARALRCYIRLIDTDGKPIEDFAKGLTANPTAWNVLLLDSDAADEGDLFAKLCRRANLSRTLDEGSVFWMVQIMESWFLADIEGLKRFYGPGLREAALHGNPNVEEIPKQDVYDRLDRATKDTGKGRYTKNKTGHAPQILCALNPELVKQAAPNCRRIFEVILEKLAA